MTLELPRSKIFTALAAGGIPGSAIQLADDFYALFSPADLRLFSTAFTDLLGQLGFKYETERRDCDDFARLAAAWAGFLHSEQPSGPRSGLAFGEIWCAARSHAFCFGVHRRDEETVVRFYEPQLSAYGFAFAEIELSRSECERIVLAKA